FGLKLYTGRRINDQFAAGKSLSEIVIGIAHQLQGKSSGDKCAEALAAGTGTVYSKGILRKSVGIISGNLSPEHGSQRPVHIGNIAGKASLLSGRKGGL